ncbi:laminin G domain protein [Dictyocaulus viviparus]|uniref:Laminin G domain protein n=1 Tax=Dictyocaulus viviparus TaxID=29172 RepID=A0A0D8XN46_DICVI|nr:laminin G domain protein [Dictyocaulus viviparus]
MSTPKFTSHVSDFSFEFRTESTDGVLWWESEWSGIINSNFFIVYLRKGRVYVAVKFGRDSTKSTTTNNFVIDRKWHRISVKRKRGRITVDVDDRMTSIMSTGEDTQLNTNGLVYLGQWKAFP